MDQKKNGGLPKCYFEFYFRFTYSSLNYSMYLSSCIPGTTWPFRRHLPWYGLFWTREIWSLQSISRASASGTESVGMVVLTPSTDAMGIISGTLVETSGLVSVRGREMNGKWGLVRGKTEAGRFEVEMLGWRTINALYVDDPDALVNLKPVNVKPLSKISIEKYGHRLFAKYIRSKRECILDVKGPHWGVWSMYETMGERFEQPWFTASLQDKIVMCSLLRTTGYVSEALARSQ